MLQLITWATIDSANNGEELEPCHSAVLYVSVQAPLAQMFEQGIEVIIPEF